MMYTESEKKNFDFFTRLSSTLNREIGICVCNDGEAFITFGNKCSGQIRCGRCEPSILFHTHPLGTAHLSVGDVRALMNLDGEMENVEYCVGAMKNGTPETNCVNVTKRKDSFILSTI